MKFCLVVKESGTGRLMREDYENAAPNPFEWATRTIDNFNNTLRTGEKSRELRMLRIISEEHRYEHQWEKTNLVTKCDQNGSWDEMKCKHCGITGRRWGLHPNVVINAKYKKSKKGMNCINS